MRLFPGSVAALALVTLAGLVGPAGTPSAAAAEQARRLDAVTLVGSGYGHGKGMSQYGAKGAADQGRTAAQILDFYYPGTAMGRAGGSIAVLLTAATSNNVVVQHKAGLKVRSAQTGKVWTLGKKGAKRWRLTPVGATKTRLSVKTNGWHVVRDIPGQAEFKGGAIRLYVPGGSALYRGKLRSAVAGAGSVRDTVNIVSVEQYLRGVVAAEMPASWARAAVQAQAVAARTYAVQDRDTVDRGHFDVWDTTRSQVYRGVAGEHPLSDAAIKATAGQIRTYGGKPAFTQFSSSNGGWSVAGSSAQPYLKAQADPYDPKTQWTQTISAATLKKVFPGIGDITDVEVTVRDGRGAWGGRAVKVKVTGTGNRSTTVSGDEFRSWLGLRSTLFDLR
ncbi:SpoIID/LytB domain-containing protein [Pimelobacter simplex]|uniref:SpoIID/LytB domain-containing protein n=1 Tax=Nocardioides simplex TaxID=2045 RepID=UPI003AAC2F78